MKKITHIILLAGLLIFNVISTGAFFRGDSLGTSDKPINSGDFSKGLRGIETRDISIFDITPNYPNPFNPVTTLRFQLPVAGHVTLSVYDVTGNLITTLVSDTRNSGVYEVKWNADKYSSGIYFYRFTAVDAADPGNVFTRTGKMLLVK